MVTDQEIGRAVEVLLLQRHSGPPLASVNDVVQYLSAKLGLDLTHKAAFIRDHINLLRRQHLPPPSISPVQFAHLYQRQYYGLHFPGFLSHALPPPPLQHNPPVVASPDPPPPKHNKESNQAGGKRRGGAGGLNKLCGVSPELQAVVGEATMARTEIVKQLWAYIRKNSLQDSSNKRKIICDEVLRTLFETDSTDMFKMNKLLTKHILPLDPPKNFVQSKRQKVDVDESTAKPTDVESPVIISDAFVLFLGTSRKEMLASEATQCVLEYIKLNNLEDPGSPTVICDEKLGELLGCKSISLVGIKDMLASHHLFQSS